LSLIKTLACKRNHNWVVLPKKSDARFRESLDDSQILHWDHEPATGERVSVLECGALRRFRTWCDPEKRRTACAHQNLRVAARFMESLDDSQILHGTMNPNSRVQCHSGRGRLAPLSQAAGVRRCAPFYQVHGKHWDLEPRPGAVSSSFSSSSSEGPRTRK